MRTIACNGGISSDFPREGPDREAQEEGDAPEATPTVEENRQRVAVFFVQVSKGFWHGPLTLADAFNLRVLHLLIELGEPRLQIIYKSCGFS